jgi:methionyl-tRNA formyltransferase
VKLVFAGTPDFAAAALSALIEARHDVALVLTQPDRPAGRGLRPAESAVKRLAADAGLPVRQPATLRDPATQAELSALRPDALVVAAYGLIVPAAVLAIPSLGAINIHASLLPRWRGAAPIQRALLAGDASTGITIMQMDAGLDTGPMLLQRPIAIAADETAGSLHDRLAELGAQCIVEALPQIAAGTLTPVPQDEDRACYAAKIEKREARLDWRRPAAELERQVRAFNPFPGATAWFRGSALKIWRAAVAEGAGDPGEVLAAGSDGIRVACGAGALRLQALQRPGGRALDAAAFLQGFPLSAGEQLDC